MTKEKRPTEDDYAMMLKKVWYKLRNEEKYVEINAQIADLLRRGEKWTILRAQ